jgi:hypothetical protein
VETTPKASGCISGGAREIFAAMLEDFLGGDGKAEAAKLLGVGILPKQRPSKSAAEKRNVQTPRSISGLGARNATRCLRMDENAEAETTRVSVAYSLRQHGRDSTTVIGFLHASHRGARSE